MNMTAVTALFSDEESGINVSLMIIYIIAQKS